MNILYLLLVSALHSFHVSTYDVRVNREASRIELIGTIFHDDMELTLKNTFGLNQYDIRADHTLTDLYLQMYFSKRLHLVASDQSLEGKWIGHRIENNSVHIYMEYPLGDSFSDLRLEMEPLSEVFDDQKNIVHLYDQELLETTIIDRKGMRVEYSW